MGRIWDIGGSLKIETILAFIVSLVVQVGYPLAIAILYRRRTRAPWQVYIYGAAIFAVFQLFTWLPLSTYLDIVIGAHLATEMGAFLWLMAMALLTSAIEEAGRWLGYRYLFPRGGYQLNWRNGVMYGLGHGSLETLLLIAGLTFVNLLAYVALSRMEPEILLSEMGMGASPAFREALQSIVNASWSQPLVVAWERVLALPHQVAWSLLVMSSLAWRQKRWFGFAVLYHASVAVIVPGLARLFGFAAAESVNMALAALSLWIILKLRTITGEE